MKRIISGVLVVASLFFMLLGPFNIFKALENKALLEQTIATYNTARVTSNNGRQGVFSSQKTFEEGRTFAVDYKNVDQLVSVLDNISNITVSSVTSVDAQQYFTAVGEYVSGDTPTAVTISLVAEDPLSALAVISKMELPVYQAFLSAPNLLDVTFLTGGNIT